MPRRTRIVLPNVAHHVTQRGSRRGMVFFSDSDRAMYLQLLKRYAAEAGTLILGYCLMDNHVHHILVPSSVESLSRTLAPVHMRYAAIINGRSGWTGHLWQERFFSSPLDDEYFWAAMRYVERNPVKAGMAGHPTEYKWSSARTHCGLGPDPILSDDSKWQQLLASQPDWHQWLSGEEDNDKVLLIKERTRRDLPCGGASFIESMEQSLGVKLFRPRGRPRKATEK